MYIRNTHKNNKHEVKDVNIPCALEMFARPTNQHKVKNDYSCVNIGQIKQTFLPRYAS